LWGGGSLHRLGRIAQKLRRLLRRGGVDVEACTPFKPGDFGQFGHDFQVPVVVIVC